MRFLLRWFPFPLWFETTWMPVPRSRYDLLERAFSASERRDVYLTRLLKLTRTRNEDLRGDRDAYRAEADHYRQLTADLEARLEAVTVIRSEFEALRDKLELI